MVSTKKARTASRTSVPAPTPSAPVREAPKRPPSRRPTTVRSGSVQAPLETYLRQINETPLLNAQDERELAYLIKDGDEKARDRMVRANLRLVVNIAHVSRKRPAAPRSDCRGKPRTDACGRRI